MLVSLSEDKLLLTFASFLVRNQNKSMLQLTCYEGTMKEHGRRAEEKNKVGLLVVLDDDGTTAF